MLETRTAKSLNRNSEQIFPEMKLRGFVPIFHIRVSVSDLYIPMIGHRNAKVGIENEAAQFHPGNIQHKLDLLCSAESSSFGGR